MPIPFDIFGGGGQEDSLSDSVSDITNCFPFVLVIYYKTQSYKYKFSEG